MLCAAACASGTAHAQSSVTLYGILDTGIEYISHADPAGDKVIRMPGNTGELPSRWGIAGTEDLGGGLQAQFVLESGFNVSSGALNQGGREFGRQAWVGINSPYGLLSFGRQYVMTYYALSDADVFYPTIYGIPSFDAYLANARSDNTVAYKGTFHGLTIGATYSFGRDSAGTGNSPGQGTCVGSVPGDPVQCRQWTALLKYDSAYFGVAASYDEQRGGATAAVNFYDGATPFPITSRVDKDALAVVDAYVKIGSALKVGSGWVGRHVTTPSSNITSNLYFLDASYLLTPAVLLDAEVQRIINQDQDARATKVALRATYLLSKRTAVYAEGAYLFNSKKAAYSVSAGGASTPPFGQGQAAAMLGVRHSF
ncbi:porin [Trinickia mobilis]|uniref:porin n=1 Tax=Trinickia mobilis TaxID=2816356 RepID=UPI001A8CAB6A|nr:porin [Trinickia mobilis]